VFIRKASWHFQIVEHFWRYFTEQYELVKATTGRITGARLSLIPILVGICGMVSMALTARRTFVLVFGTFLITSFGMIFFLNFSDAEVRERDYFYSPAFYFFGAFIGVGMAALIDWFFLSRRKVQSPGFLDRFGAVAGIVVFLLFTGLLYNRYHFEHDRSGEWVPWGYGHNMLVGLEPNAIIFTNGDNDTFPLWFQQEVEGFRKDVRVINLSLLNTTWYPRQLRDQEPIVKLSWTDQDIERLPERARDLYIRSEGREAMQPRDFAVRQIVRDNFNEKPIYFAVTIPQEFLQPYEEHLVLEGIVYRLVREKGKDMRDFDKMADNVDNKYDFRGILNPDGTHDDSVYRDFNQQTLVQNYSGSFIRLGQHDEELAAAAATPEERQRLVERAIERYRTALEISPHFETLSLLLGTVYQENGRLDEARAHFEAEIAADPGNDRFRFELARTYLMMERNNEAVELLRQVARGTPDDEFLWQYLVYTLWELGRPQEAEQVIREWESTHVGSRRLRDFYDASRQGIVNFPSDVPRLQKSLPAPEAAPGSLADSMAGKP
jgi:tetratricopeptide (TPR) repeat protein